MSTKTAKPDEPTVREWGDWKVVQAGSWEVSISPDGLLMLPRHLHPREVDDFVRAATYAAKIGAEMMAANEKRAEGDDRTIPPARPIVTEGRPPAGALPMLITPVGTVAPHGSIGRRLPGSQLPPGTDVPAPQRRRH